MKFRSKHRLICDLPGAVPIGCVLFLLLFFLINNSALLLVEGMPVRLPEVAGQRPTGFSDSVVVAMASPLRPNGPPRYFYLNQQVKLPELQAALKRLAASAGDAELLLVLKADRDVKNHAIMQVAVAAQQVGVRQTWLATRPRLFELRPREQ